MDKKKTRHLTGERKGFFIFKKDFMSQSNVNGGLHLGLAQKFPLGPFLLDHR